MVIAPLAPSEACEQLLVMARAAASRAYCPYSHFPVGAAVATADGQVFTGSNIENASYGLAICAERAATFAAVSAGSVLIVRVAVSCIKGQPRFPHTLMPCGACRQVLAEFASPDCRIAVDGVGEILLSELLPRPFALNESFDAAAR